MRSGKYSPDKREECYNWIVEHGLSQHGGATLFQYCEAMDIDSQTHYNWLNEFSQGKPNHLYQPDYADAVKKAKAIFKAKMVRDVTNALTKKALGYEDEKTEAYGYLGDDGKFHTEKAKRVKVTVPPDTGAAIFLLTNLDPDNWKNRQDTNTRYEEIQRAEIQVVDEEDKSELEKARNGIRRKG